MQLDNLKILICDDSILARKQMKDINRNRAMTPILAMRILHSLC